MSEVREQQSSKVGEKTMVPGRFSAATAVIMGPPTNQLISTSRFSSAVALKEPSPFPCQPFAHSRQSTFAVHHRLHTTWLPRPIATVRNKGLGTCTQSLRIVAIRRSWTRR